MMHSPIHIRLTFVGLGIVRPARIVYDFVKSVCLSASVSAVLMDGFFVKFDTRDTNEKPLKNSKLI